MEPAMKTALKLSAAVVLGLSGLTAASAAAYAQDEAAAAAETGAAEEARSDRRWGPRRGHHRAGGRMFERLADEDGVITRDAFLESHAERFERMDADNDGVLTDADRQALREQWAERSQERRAEWQARRAERGEDASERSERRQRWAERRGEVTDEQRAERRERMGERRQAHLERMGADADGNITREAFLAHGDAMFDRIAGEGEDQVTLEELRAKAEEARERRGERRNRDRG
jgi:hypothetical protein